MARGRIARKTDRSLAYVVCGDHIILVGGSIVQGSRDTFVEDLPAARRGDSVQYGCGKVGRITQRLTRKTYINSRGVALYNSGVTGSGIIRGWITQASRRTYAG